MRLLTLIPRTHDFLYRLRTHHAGRLYRLGRLCAR